MKQRIYVAALCIAVLLTMGLGHIQAVLGAFSQSPAIEMLEDKSQTLEITNLAAPGTHVPADLYFKMQVVIDDALLPAGTCYIVNGEQRSVETDGILFLRVGETAVIKMEPGAGGTYQVTELSAAFDGYHPIYEGTAMPAEEIVCTVDGAAGGFPLDGTVHITITNADHNTAIQMAVSNSGGE